MEVVIFHNACTVHTQFSHGRFKVIKLTINDGYTCTSPGVFGIDGCSTDIENMSMEAFVAFVFNWKESIH